MRTEANDIVVVHTGIGRSVCTYIRFSRQTNVLELTLNEASRISLDLAIAVARQDGSHANAVAELVAERDGGIGAY